MRSSQILLNAQRLIVSPERWCTGEYEVEDSAGGPSSYCALGALRESGGRWTGDDAPNEVNQAWQYLSAAAQEYANTHEPLRKFDYNYSWHPIPYVNDYYGHDAVMEVFAAAIEKALEKELESHTGHINDDPPVEVLEAVGR